MGIFDNEGLEKDVKFVVGQLFDQFKKTWETFEHDNKISWVDTWSTILFRYRPEIIKQVGGMCVKELISPPAAPTFCKYCSEYCIKGKVEMPGHSAHDLIAIQVLESLSANSEIADESISDILLHAASASMIKTNIKSGIKLDYSINEHKGRANMFGMVSQEDYQYSLINKGIWAKYYSK